MCWWIGIWIVAHPSYMVYCQHTTRIYKEKFHDQLYCFDPTSFKCLWRRFQSIMKLQIVNLISSQIIFLCLFETSFPKYTNCHPLSTLAFWTTKYTTFWAFDVNIVSNANTYALSIKLGLCSLPFQPAVMEGVDLSAIGNSHIPSSVCQTEWKAASHIYNIPFVFA